MDGAPGKLFANPLGTLHHTLGTTGLDKVFRDSWICGMRRASPVHRDSSCFGFTSTGTFMGLSYRSRRGSDSCSCGRVWNYPGHAKDTWESAQEHVASLQCQQRRRWAPCRTALVNSSKIISLNTQAKDTWESAQEHVASLQCQQRRRLAPCRTALVNSLKKKYH
jgi:hypothetical protein